MFRMSYTISMSFTNISTDTKVHFILQANKNLYNVVLTNKVIYILYHVFLRRIFSMYYNPLLFSYLEIYSVNIYKGNKFHFSLETFNIWSIFLPNHIIFGIDQRIRIPCRYKWPV